jgi:hypothetical protein
MSLNKKNSLHNLKIKYKEIYEKYLKNFEKNENIFDKIFYVYFSKKKIEEDYLNGFNFKNINLVENFIKQINLPYLYSILISEKYYSINEFFNLFLNSLENNNNNEKYSETNKIIKEEIENNIKIYNNKILYLKCIREINNKYNEENSYYFDNLE